MKERQPCIFSYRNEDQILLSTSVTLIPPTPDGSSPNKRDSAGLICSAKLLRDAGGCFTRLKALPELSFLKTGGCARSMSLANSHYLILFVWSGACNDERRMVECVTAKRDMRSFVSTIKIKYSNRG